MRLFASLMLSSFLFLTILVPIASFAETTTNTEINTIIDLSKKLAELKSQVKASSDQQDTAVFNFLSGLRQGSNGDAVIALQTLLATNPDLYPEGLITGHFGRATERAIKRFQRANNLEQVGRVGPKTLKQLYKLVDKYKLDEDGVGVEKKSQKHSSANATGTINVNVTVNNGNGDCSMFPPGWLKGNAWWKQFLVRVHCKVLPGTTTPDTIAPIISELTARDINEKSAKIRWNTNEPTRGIIYYGTTSPLSIGSAAKKSDSSFRVSHEIEIEGLEANTAYYTIVVSTDRAGNTATSSQISFTTSGAPDTAKPVISSITTQNIGSSTATINWVTNESATSKVYYGTTSPLNLGSASALSNATLVINHSLNLTGLSASTTYYFVAESKDAANNTATSSEQSFTTTL